jgi:membrane-associated phospholipid phosphatase
LLILTAVALIAAHLPSLARGMAWLYAAFILLPPFACIGWLKRQGRISDFDLSVRQERVVPMTVAWMGLIAAWFMLQWADAPPLLSAFALLQIIQGAIFLFVTLFWKISLHTTAVASLAALWWVVHGLSPIFWALLLLISLVAWARLRLNRHTAAQTIAGAALGILACLTVWQIYGV